jgi:hypothetical protein
MSKRGVGADGWVTVHFHLLRSLVLFQKLRGALTAIWQQSSKDVLPERKVDEKTHI